MQTLKNKLCNDEVTRPGGVRARDVERHSREIGRGRTPTLTSYREDAYNHLGNRDFVTNSGTATFKTKPQTYDGTEELDEYVTHFNIVSDINGWTYPVKSLMLARSMKGPCLSLLNDLSEHQRKDYGSLLEALQSRYGTQNRAEIYRARLQSKTQGRNETISEMALAIRNLTRKAYPSASTQVIELLALEYFIDALPDADIRLRLREVGQKSIGEAEQITVRLEAHKVADRSRGKHSVRSLEPNEDPASNSFGRLSSQLREVIGQLKRITLSKSTTQSRSRKPKLVECEDRQSTQPPRSNTEECVSVTAKDDGLFVSIKIQETATTLLIDTGSNITILRKDLVENINKSGELQIENVNLKMVTATGEVAPFFGKFKANQGSKQFCHDVYIADIKNDGILVRNVVIDGEKIPCYSEIGRDNSTCRRITVKENVVISPATEMIVTGKLEGPTMNSMGIVEGNSNFIEKHGTLIAKSVVNFNKGEIPLRKANVGTLYKNSYIANYETVSLECGSAEGKCSAEANEGLTSVCTNVAREVYNDSRNVVFTKTKSGDGNQQDGSTSSGLINQSGRVSSEVRSNSCTSVGCPRGVESCDTNLHEQVPSSEKVSKDRKESSSAEFSIDSLREAQKKDRAHS
ncbi:hypothetical protein MAR_030076 [Mya arenaria]|uniref:Peptidase A2 domain-containing protein n=1 Tax=Mya arenaria TaxID=6604 RepID=A0ABY7DLB3_MYAAR|nr:hypothetical protein MAR_030076 [Mya arenaria]